MQVTKQHIALLLTTTITLHAIAPAVGASIAGRINDVQCETRLGPLDFGPSAACDAGQMPPKASVHLQLSGSSTASNLDITIISGRSFYTVDEATVVDAITDQEYSVRFGEQRLTKLTPRSS